MRQRFVPDDENRKALVIGVDRAPQARDADLRSQLNASADATAMAETLREYSGFDLVHAPFINEDATSERIKIALEEMVNTSNKTDFLLLYFSGHGHFLPHSHPDLVHMYLITHDFAETVAEQNEDQFLTLHWLLEHFYRSRRPGKILIILDCCFAGYIAHASPTPTDAFSATFGDNDRSLGFRKALGASGPLESTRDGRMTTFLLKALQGKVDEVIETSAHNGIKLGDVLYTSIYAYIMKKMPEGQKPTDSGTDAAQMVILTRHEDRAMVLQSSPRPTSFLGKALPYPYFQRPDEIEGWEILLQKLKEVEQDTRHILGLIGQPFVGKTYLARILAEYSEGIGRYSRGIFWIEDPGDDYPALLKQLADIARTGRYLPPDNNESDPANNERLARYFCHYLTAHKDVLLILDNLTQPGLIDIIFTQLGEKTPNCTILYTARDRVMSNMPLYEVKPFSPETAMTVLLKDIRRRDLEAYKKDQNSKDVEVKAAKKICWMIEGNPLNLQQLRDILSDDPQLSLVQLLTMVQGADKALPDLDKPLRANWEQVIGKELQDLFLLAVLFPETTAIPLWLFELAIECVRQNRAQSIGSVLKRLQDLGWIESDRESITLKRDERFLSIHPRRYHLGLSILSKEEADISSLREQAACWIEKEFLNLDALYQRAARNTYWQALEQIRTAHMYVQKLSAAHALSLAKVENWLDRESALIMGKDGTSLDKDEIWQATRFKDLFYQQLYNHSIEENIPLTLQNEPSHWLRLECPTGAEDRALQRILAGHHGHVRCLAISPDGKQILTGSNDTTVRLWESATGKIIKTLTEHTAHVLCAAFSFDGRFIATGAEDEKICIWDSWSETAQMLPGHTGAIYCIAFLDDMHVITGSSDHTVRIWEKENGKVIKLWRAPSYVRALLVTQKRGILIAGSTTLWQWTEWQEQLNPRLFQRLEATISCIAISRDEQYLAIGFLHPPRVHIWTWKQNEYFKLRTLSSHTRSVKSIAFSPNGQLLVTGAEDETAYLWDTTEWFCKAIIKGHIGSITSTIFSGDSILITGSTHNTARIWDIDLAVKNAATDDMWTDEKQNTLMAADNLYTEPSTHFVNRHTEISPNEKYAIIFGTDTVEVWEIETRECRSTFQIARIKRVFFSPESSIHFFIVLSNFIEQRSCEDGTLLKRQSIDTSPEHFMQKGYAKTGICQRSLDTQKISILTLNQRYRIESEQEGILTCWDEGLQHQKDPRWEIVIVGQITYLSFSPDERILAVGTIHGRAFFFEWNPRRNSITRIAGLYQALDQIVAIHWQSENKVLVVDASPVGHPPHFHFLQLEGKWGNTTTTLSAG